ncbi:MAG: hypothetical protein ACKVI4_16390 [Actinomycetales bacterium]
MAPKTSKKSARPPSPAAEEPEPELDDTPGEPPAKKKGGGKGKKRAQSEEPAAEGEPVAQAPTKKKRAKKAPAPEPDPEPEEEAEEEEAGDEGEGIVDAQVLVTYFKDFRKLNHRLPTGEELAEAFEIDVAAGESLRKKKKALDEKLTNQRTAKKVLGYNKMAVEAGFGNFSVAMKNDEAYSMAIARGTDARAPVISMSDTLRMATTLPANLGKASYMKDEFARRLANSDTRLPVEACRVLQANANDLFNKIHYASMSTVAQQCKTQKIRASHAIALLKPMAEQMSFSSVLAPPGLVLFGKESGILPEADGDAARKKEVMADAKLNSAAAKAWLESQPKKAEKAEKAEKAAA